MKIIIIYPSYNMPFSSLGIQARLLERGLKEEGVECRCFSIESFQEKEYDFFKPDVVIGIGYWGDIPRMITPPIGKGIKAVPWFNADGWVANYHEILNNLPLLVVTSNWVRSTYIRDGVKENHMHVLPIGFDERIFKPSLNDSARKFREMLGVKEDEKMILTAGGDVTSKGAQEMFGALAKVNEKFKKWKYVCKIINNESAQRYRVEEEKIISIYGLKEKVIYHEDILGREEMALLLNACDIYAAPSRLEGFGMVQLEAQACGKPVISINVGGPRDIIVHGKTGFLADVAYEIKLNKEWAYPSMGFKEKMLVEFPIPKTFAYRADIGQLAEYVLRLLQDDGLREKMGKAAMENAVKNFNYRDIAKKMLELIERYVM